MDTIKHSMRRIKTAFLTTFYPWFKEMTRIMMKSYFFITIFFAITLLTAKEQAPLHEVAFAVIFWGYTIAITYWLLKQEILSEKWTNALHFLIWLMVYMISGIRIIGFFPPIIGFVLIDYWIISGIQIYLVRKTVEKEFNIGFNTVKDRWHNDNIEMEERSERFRML